MKSHVGIFVKCLIRDHFLFKRKIHRYVRKERDHVKESKYKIIV